MSDIFEKSLTRKEVKCKICDCWLPSNAEKFLKSHVEGRKHKQQAFKKDRKKEMLEKSVYVKGFDPSLENLEGELKAYFTKMDVEVTDIYVDKNLAAYAIIEFTNNAAVQKVLQAKQQLFHDSKLVIRERQPAVTINNNNDNGDDQIKEVKCFLPEALRAVLHDHPKDITKQMNLLYNYYKLTAEELELRSLMCQLIQSVLEEVYEGCQIKMFGSSVNSLGMTNCDVDLTMIINETVEKEVEILTNTREVLQKVAPGCKHVTLVNSTKHCNIVTFFHTQAKVNVDLSLNNRLALANTELMLQYINLHPLILPLLFTLRIWFKSHDLTGRKSHQISNYALTIMFIHYLQQNDVLPWLQSCHHEKTNNTVESWDCSFCKQCTVNNVSKLDENCLTGFFNYYLSLDLTKYAVTIHSKDLITQHQCKEIAIENLYFDDLKLETPLVVQDPFKLSHNITQNVNISGLQNILILMRTSKRHLEASKDGILCLFSNVTLESRLKQKKQRNRSNVYHINLPNCYHTKANQMLNGSAPLTSLNDVISDIDLTDDSKLYCFNAVHKILEDDLKMSLDQENNEQVSNSSSINKSKSENDSKASENNLDNIKTPIANESSRKRKLSEECHTEESSVAKKCKQENVVIVFNVKASVDTWTNRRKQRRIKLQNEAVAMETNNQSDKLVQSNDTSDNHTVKNEELLNFQLKIFQSSTKEDVCKIILKPFNPLKNTEQFQTFFAYFKKEIITFFK